MHTQGLIQTQELYQVVINHLSDGIYMVDRDRNILVWNDTAEKITGYSQDEMIAQGCAADLLADIDHTKFPYCDNGCPIMATLMDGGRRVNELFFRHKKGYRVPVVLHTAPILQDGLVIGALAVFSDKSIQVRENDLVSSLTKLVMTDQLTGLSNKRHTEAVLKSKLEDFKHFGSKFCVLFINLDDFSDANTLYDYETGNLLLVKIASTLQESIRGTDLFGRWGGEEFVGLFEIKSPDHLKLVSEKVRHMIRDCQLNRQGVTLSVTASIGATMANSGDNAKDLVDRAASLMHVSKISGKDCSTLG